MTDTKHKNIYMALAAAQSQMGPVFKGAVNPHFKSKYADLADVMQVATPALNAEGIATWASIVTLEGEKFMRTTLSHGETDTHITCDVPLLVNKNDMQGMKSATTYAKRIGIESLTGIAPEDDDGNAAASAPPKEPTGPSAKAINDAKNALLAAASLDDLRTVFIDLPHDIISQHSVISAKNARKAELELAPAYDLNGDDIPDFPPAPQEGE